MNPSYPSAAAALLSYGDPRNLSHTDDPNGWPDYVKMAGLGVEDIPHLPCMLTDPAIKTANADSAPAWADIHAWRALGQLCAVEAIQDLLSLLDDDEESSWDDWAMEEIPTVLRTMGTPAIDPLVGYLESPSHGTWSVSAAAHGLEYIAKDRPEERDRCITGLSQRLAQYKVNEPNLNAFLIGNLVHLRALENLELIRQAFRAGAVDISVRGDVEDVEIDLGVRETRATPRPNYGWIRESRSVPPKRTDKVGRNDPCPCGVAKNTKNVASSKKITESFP
jgi:hypothetical protein